MTNIQQKIENAENRILELKRLINYWKNGRDIQSTERVGKDLDILDSIPYGDKVRTEQTRQEQQQRPNPLDSMPIATNDYGECVDTLLDSMNESDTNW
tara:strand:- start:235 stop:528 length:294 start_codon:yes stop_codon:yes gene_type:complete